MIVTLFAEFGILRLRSEAHLTMPIWECLKSHGDGVSILQIQGLRCASYLKPAVAVARACVAAKYRITLKPDPEPPTPKPSSLDPWPRTLNPQPEHMRLELILGGSPSNLDVKHGSYTCEGTAGRPWSGQQPKLWDHYAVKPKDACVLLFKRRI